MGAFLAAAGFTDARAASPPHVVLISGEYEYSSMITLPALADYLEREHGFRTTFLKRSGGENIPGLEALEQADLAILCIRRMTLPEEQLNRFKAFVAAGKPVIGIRTTSHAFENWKEWDPEVLGGNYHGHYKNHLVATAQVVDRASRHPILRGVAESFETGGSLYQTAPLAEGTALLLTGTVEQPGAAPEPVAWTHRKGRARVFYTSLGDARDFLKQPFIQLMVNAVHWGLDRPVPEKPARAIESFPVPKVDVEAFEHYARHHRTQALDMRTPDEFAEGHVAKSINIDYYADDLKEQLGRLDRQRPYAVYCRSGGRSGRTAKLMKEMGFQFVYDFSGSMNAWEKAGKPVTK